MMGWLRRLSGHFSTGGLLLGMLLFSLSLTPSLLPRDSVMQGLLSGCAFAAGYGIGVFLEWLWRFLELGLPRRSIARAARLLAIGILLAVTIASLWQWTDWQNSIRAVMGMPPQDFSLPVRVAVIALLPATLLIMLGTLFVHSIRVLARRVHGLVPRRVGILLSMIVVGLATTFLVNDVLLRWALNAADRFYANLDSLAGQFEAAPTDPLRSGSPQSLIAWNTIGRDARPYVQSGPTAAEIEAITGRPAMAPLRVYVGLNSAAMLEERAALALAEMQRVGAFDRSILVLIMPVGTGWVDPPGIDTLEFLHGGDVASVAMQYSYLTSWISILVDADVGTATAQALFSSVYDYWVQLPPERRPQLYLHGLSLGAYASQASVSLLSIIGDPFQGALWVGSPFPSSLWRQATANREPGTPQWLPRYGDSSAIRFKNQFVSLDIPGVDWGPMHVVFMQYGSDPIVFFDPSILYRRPDWLEGQRARDVSPALAWYPVVTFLQVALDMALSQRTPIGYGHVYAPVDYVRAWVAVTDPPGWNESDLADLEARLHRTGDYTDIAGGWFRN